MSLRTLTPPRQDFAARLLERSPPDLARTFTAEQLGAIEDVLAEADYSWESSFDDEWPGADAAELEPRASATVQPASDRRRPGRHNHVYSSLMSLLRHPTASVNDEIEDDDLRPTLGVASVILVSIGVWICVLIGMLVMLI